VFSDFKKDAVVALVVCGKFVQDLELAFGVEFVVWIRNSRIYKF
jgi:hypothetical protein